VTYKVSDVRRQTKIFAAADKLMLIVAITVMGLLPPLYQSIPNFIGIFLLAGCCARVLSPQLKSQVS